MLDETMTTPSLLQECLQVVRRIGDELEKNGEACNLARILAILRQALQLAAVYQARATGTAQGESVSSSASGTPTSPQSPVGIPVAEEDMDTGGRHSPVSSHSPLGVAQEQMTSVPPGAMPTRSRRPPPSLPTTRARRPRTAPRSAGGSHRAYVVQQHYIHRHDSPRGICSLEGVPKKNPDALIRHVAGDSTDKLVPMISYVLQTQQLEANRDDIVEKILRVAETQAPYCPADMSRPSGTGEEALDGWECTTPVKHIQSLLLLSKSVEVLADYQIGRYLAYLANNSSHAAANSIIARLCTHAATDELQQYHQILSDCGCSDCLRDGSWLDANSPTERSRPCRMTEAKTKCLHDSYKNFEPTFLRQCLLLAEAIPPNHPLLFAQHVPSAARVRQLAPVLQKEIAKIERINGMLPSSPACLAQCAVFSVSKSDAIKAIDYVDGDGGYLAANLIPGFSEYLDQRRLTASTLEQLEDRGMTLVAFREFGHDAIELSHVYRRSDQNRTKNLGIDSLRLARNLVATSERILLCTGGQLDAYSKRLVVEVLAVTDGTLTSNAQRQLLAGLSVPLRGAPATFRECAAKAKENNRGIYGIFPASVADSPEMAPQNLRTHLQGGSRQFVYTVEDATYKVSTPSEWRNDSHMVLRDSTINGAGIGVFARACPPSRQTTTPATPVHIRMHDQVCLYSKRPFSGSIAQLPNTDYLLEKQTSYGNRTIMFDASVYDGSNIARFANDKGLLPGLRKLVELSDRTNHPLGCEWAVVERTARNESNCVFKVKGGSTLILQATRDIVLGSQSQEIFVSYGVEGYWLPYIAAKVNEWGTGNEMVQALMWCTMSDQSNWDPTLRTRWLNAMKRSCPDIEAHCTIACPWPDLIAPLATRARVTRRIV